MNISFSIDPCVLRAALLFASTDEVRFVLCGVSVEIIPKQQLTVVATDGRRMIVINATDRAEFAQVETPCKFIIPRDLLEAMPKPSGGKKTPRLTVRFDGGIVTIEGSNHSTSHDASFNGANFPSWLAVLPEGEQASMREINFNAELFMPFFQAAKILAGAGVLASSPCVTIFQTANKFGSGPDLPFTIKAESCPTPWIGLLMPVRTSMPAHGNPDWIMRLKEHAKPVVATEPVITPPAQEPAPDETATPATA